MRQYLATQLGLATTSRPHHRQYLPLPDIKGRSALSALSILNCTHINFIKCLFHSLHKSHAHIGLPVVSYTFHHHAKNNSFIGFRNGEYGGSIARETVGGQQTNFGLGLYDEISRCPIPQRTDFFDCLHHSYALMV